MEYVLGGEVFFLWYDWFLMEVKIIFIIGLKLNVIELVGEGLIFYGKLNVIELVCECLSFILL